MTWIRCVLRWSALGVFCLSCLSAAHAQFSSNYQTNVINGVVSIWGGDYIVGSNAVFDLLSIQNGGGLSNGNGYVGYTSNAYNNSALVAGTGSAWNSTGNLNIGSGGNASNGVTLMLGVYGGSSNSLALSDGAVVSCVGGSVGAGGTGVTGGTTFGSDPASFAGGAGGDGNSAIVSGLGSAWLNNAYVNIGAGGNGAAFGVYDDYYRTAGNGGAGGNSNSLVVSEGGELYSASGNIGAGGTGAWTTGHGGNAGSGNTLMVAGTGSVWSNGADVRISSGGVGGYMEGSGYPLGSGGAGGSNNSIVISDGGLVYSVGADIGGGGTGGGGVGGPGGVGGNDSYASVVGIGSVWRNGGEMGIGDGADSGVYLGNSGAGGNSNSLVIAAGSVVYCVGAKIGCGGNNFDSGYGSGGTGGSGNSILVSDFGSMWNCAADLEIGVDGQTTLSGYGNSYGFGGSGNSLVVSNGGAVTTAGLSIGVPSAGVGNSVIVFGASLTVTNTTANAVLVVGRSNTLQVVDGTVTADNLVLTNQTVTFDGSVTLSTGAATLDYGTNQFLMGDSAGKTMTWTAHSGTNSLNASQMVVGAAAGSAGHMVINSAVFQSSSVIYVGSNGVGNGVGSLVISNGVLLAPGLVSGFNGSGTISNIAGVFLFDTALPKVVANGSNTIVGINATLEFYGVTNAPLEVDGIEWQGSTSFQMDSATNVMVGAYTFGLDNPQGYQTLDLVGGTTLWQSSNLVIGTGGTLLLSNTVATLLTVDQKLVVTNGGQVLSAVGAGRFNPNSSGFGVVVEGTNAVWNSSSDFAVGYNGPGDSLVVSNGGTVYDNDGYLGYNTSSSNNDVMVDGTLSVWSNLVSLFVGFNGPSNSMTVADNGSVVTSNAYIGYSATGNSLAVNTSASMYDSVGYVGYNNSSSNNSVVISGSGSVWSNRSGFYIGSSGCGDRLTVTNGGALYNRSGYVGFNGSSSCNTVIVSGAASLWNNAGNLYVGFSGRTNQLMITDNGSVIASNAYVSYNSNSVSNQISIAGGSLYVTNAAHNAVLDVRSGRVVLSDGLLQVDILVVTNANGHFIHTGGTLIVGTVVLDPNGFRIISVTPKGNNMLITWMMGPGATNALQVASGDANGYYNTNGFNDIFIVTNNTATGSLTNYLDIGAATNAPSRYYRVRFSP